MKNKLRIELMRLRREMPRKEKRILDREIFRKLVSLEEYRRANTVLTYVSTDFEVDTRALIEFALRNGKNVAVPKCEKLNMTFHLINSPDDLQPGSFGILEPRNYCPMITYFPESICVVPALCYDEGGHRIGYGKGYYDRFLKRNPCMSVGICYENFIRDFDVEPHDERVNVIITESEHIRRIYGEQRPE